MPLMWPSHVALRVAWVPPCHFIIIFKIVIIKINIVIHCLLS